MHLFCNQVRIDHSRSSKVDDFGTNRKRVWYFLLVRHSNQGPIISDMLQLFGWKLQIFPILLSCGAPLRMFYLELLDLVYTKKLTSHGAILQWRPHDRSLSHFDTIPARHWQTDRQTDGRTDGRIYYSSYGVLLTRCKKHYICDHINSNWLIIHNTIKQKNFVTT